jgi:hypothetical protein
MECSRVGIYHIGGVQVSTGSVVGRSWPTVVPLTDEEFQRIPETDHSTYDYPDAGTDGYGDEYGDDDGEGNTGNNTDNKSGKNTDNAGKNSPGKKRIKKPVPVRIADHPSAGLIEDPVKNAARKVDNTVVPDNAAPEGSENNENTESAEKPENSEDNAEDNSENNSDNNNSDNNNSDNNPPAAQNAHKSAAAGNPEGNAPKTVCYGRVECMEAANLTPSILTERIRNYKY